MDQVIVLSDIVQQTIVEYNNVIAWKARSYYLENLPEQVFAVLDVPNSDHPLVHKPGVVVMAHVLGNTVVIDEDITDRPLYEALMEAGIPREQIILAYAGEKMPDEANLKED